MLPGQRRLWAAEQLAGTQPAFAVAAAYRVSGPLDTSALAQAFAALSDRHEALRTRFVAADGAPVQVIDPPGTATAPEWLELGDTTDRQDAIRALAERFFARPFDLEAGPLWRVALAPQGPAEHLLLIAIHHIVVDDWSVGLLLDDLREFYRDSCAGRTPSRVPPSLQFADICVARAKAPTRADELAYWRERLADLPSTPPLPYDATPDPVSGDDAADGAYEGGLLRLRIDGAQTAALRAAAAARGTTPFVWLLSCFEAALFGLGGARTVAVGTPLAGRDEPGTESTVGYFVNPAVLFTHVPTEGSFADMLATVGRCVVEAHANGETPFETIQSTLGLDGPGRRPFHVWFTVLTHAQPRQLGEDLAVEPLYLERRPARFPLALVMEPDGDGLIGHLEYARAAYLPQTAALLAEALQAVLALTLETPETPLGEIERRCVALKAAAESRLAESFAGRQRGRLAAARRRPTGTGGTAP